MPGLPTGETGLRERREEAAVSCDGHKMSLLSRARWSLHPGVNNEPHRLPSGIYLKAHQPRPASPTASHTHKHTVLARYALSSPFPFRFHPGGNRIREAKSLPKTAQGLEPPAFRAKLLPVVPPAGAAFANFSGDAECP